MSVIVPLLGLAGEAGGLLSEYKKYLRDGAAHRLFKERVSEELGDILWYVANVAAVGIRELVGLDYRISRNTRHADTNASTPHAYQRR